MAGKVGMPFSAGLHPRGIAGLFTQKPVGLKVKKKRIPKGTAHLASPAKKKKMMTKSPIRTKPIGLPTG